MENVSPHTFICSNLRTLFHYLCFGRENNSKCNIISVHHHLKDTNYFPISLISLLNLTSKYTTKIITCLYYWDKQWRSGVGSIVLAFFITHSRIEQLVLISWGCISLFSHFATNHLLMNLIHETLLILKFC